VTAIEQIEFVDSAALQVLLAANSAAFTPLIATPEICKAPPPEFLRVINLAALVVPIDVLEKLNEDGDTASFGAVCASAVGTTPADCKKNSDRATRSGQYMNFATLIELTENSKLKVLFASGTLRQKRLKELAAKARYFCTSLVRNQKRGAAVGKPNRNRGAGEVCARGVRCCLTQTRRARHLAPIKNMS
jgi:hypothetical protein